MPNCSVHGKPEDEQAPCPGCVFASGKDLHTYRVAEAAVGGGRFQQIVVCAQCSALATWDPDEGVWRHAAVDPYEDNTYLCDGNGYPIQVKLINVVEQEGIKEGE